MAQIVVHNMQDVMCMLEMKKEQQCINDGYIAQIFEAESTIESKKALKKLRRKGNHYQQQIKEYENILAMAEVEESKDAERIKPEMERLIPVVSGSESVIVPSVDKVTKKKKKGSKFQVSIEKLPEDRTVPSVPNAWAVPPMIPTDVEESKNTVKEYYHVLEQEKQEAEEEYRSCELSVTHCLDKCENAREALKQIKNSCGGVHGEIDTMVQNQLSFYEHVYCEEQLQLERLRKLSSKAEVRLSACIRSIELSKEQFTVQEREREIIYAENGISRLHEIARTILALKKMYYNKFRNLAEELDLELLKSCVKML